MTTRTEELVRRVYSYFVFRLRQPQEAEQLTRLTFQRARHADRRAEEELDPELRIFSAARAVIATHPRRRGARRLEPPRIGRAVDRDEASGVALGEGGEVETRRGIAPALAVAIGRLHGRERDALALRFGAELRIDQISELLDRTPVDVKQRLARGVRSLVDLGALPGERPGAKRSAQRAGSRRAQQRKPQQGQTRKQRE